MKRRDFLRSAAALPLAAVPVAAAEGLKVEPPKPGLPVFVPGTRFEIGRATRIVRVYVTKPRSILFTFHPSIPATVQELPERWEVEYESAGEPGSPPGSIVTAKGIRNEGKDPVVTSRSTTIRVRTPADMAEWPLRYGGPYTYVPSDRVEGGVAFRAGKNFKPHSYVQMSGRGQRSL